LDWNEFIDINANTPPALLEYAKKASPFNRLGTISDIGDATALIASESARWISGQSINLNGIFHKLLCLAL
jgi:NAD(P)-dependent dehydrogenase (short-subunit alcohol dehydrogenase family)